MRIRWQIVCLSILLAVQPPPAAAQGDFLSDLFMPESRERSVAEAEHPKILAEFGGAYQNKALQTYVQSLVDFLGKASDRPDIKYRVTILNSPIVNAFALPAGYLYVTRGLLALANNEAELAGVLAHEIGHVTARHTAKRYSRSVVAEGLVSILGALTQDSDLKGLTQLAQPIAAVALQSYSREQENEADRLGVKTLARAGYDPYAMAWFLSSLEAKTKLDQKLAGMADDGGGGLDLMATHPRTADRVRSTIQEAKAKIVDKPMVARDVYLKKIDGIIYGDDPAQGFVRGRTYAHPILDFRFQVPKGFALLNGQSQVMARGPDNAVIQFDMVKVKSGTKPDDYIRDDWAKGATLRAEQPMILGGVNAATARTRVNTQNGEADLRLVAIDAPKGHMFRFLFASPPQASAGLDGEFLRTAESFRRLTAKERRQLRPYRVRLVEPKAGEDIKTLAGRMAVDSDKEEQFRVLNGLDKSDTLAAGAPVKIIAAR